MNKKKLTTILLVLATVLYVVTLYKLFVLSDTVKQFRSMIMNLKNNETTYKREIYCIKQNFMSNYFKRFSVIPYIVDANGDSISIHDFFTENDSVLLVSVISEDYCSGCNHYAFDLVNSVNYPKTIFLNKSTKKFSFMNMKQSFNMPDNKLFGCSDEITEIDRIAYPYYAFVTPPNIISAVYIPSAGNNKLDKEMLERMLGLWK